MTGDRQASATRDRKQRLGAALRANLQRRKARGRSVAEASAEQPAPAQPTDDNG